MAINTLTPRLRNSSINGTRFTIDLSPDIQKHLTELNSILGKASFGIDKTVDIEEIEKLKKKVETVAGEVSEGEKSSWDSDDAANDLELSAAAAEGKAKQVEDILKKTQGHAKQALERELELRKADFEAADLIAKAARQEANDKRDAYTKKKEEAETLTLAFTEAMLAGMNGKQHRDEDNVHFDLEQELNKPLFPKKTEAAKWDPAGILSFILKNEQAGKLTISDCIDKVNELSNLKHAFQQYLTVHRNMLDENHKAVMNSDMFPNVFDYVVAYGYWIKGITDVNAMFNFVRTHKFGAKAVVDYAVVSSARSMIQKASLKIEVIGGKTYNDDDHPLIKKILSSNLSLQEDVFASETEKILKNFIENDKEVDLIDFGLKALKIDEDDLPSSYYPTIINYIRKSTVDIDEDNITYFLPIFINRIKGTTIEEEDEAAVDQVESDTDFDVEFLEEEKTTIKTNAANIKCAAQLMSSCIMDLDVDIFNLTNFLTNSYLIRNRIDLEDKRLRQNLQLFVFSNKFIDLKSGEKMDRTDPGERQHFYRQVFNIGNGPVPQGVIVNQKFPKLWSQLIPAVKEYLDNAASSLSEDAFVSKGGVMQIVSGMKNNLSANCTSMAKIISPIINAEWNFILTKILGHPEIVKQVSPAVGSWKGVAETLYAEMKQSNLDASLAYDKARLSNAILRAVADYSPREFEEGENFINFCSMVIELDNLNQSISEDFVEMPEEEEDSEVAAAEKEAYGNNGHIAKAPQANGGMGDWDF